MLHGVVRDYGIEDAVASRECRRVADEKLDLPSLRARVDPRLLRESLRKVGTDGDGTGFHIRHGLPSQAAADV